MATAAYCRTLRLSALGALRAFSVRRKKRGGTAAGQRRGGGGREKKGRWTNGKQDVLKRRQNVLDDLGRKELAAQAECEESEDESLASVGCLGSGSVSKRIGDGVEEEDGSRMSQESDEDGVGSKFEVSILMKEAQQRGGQERFSSCGC